MTIREQLLALATRWIGPDYAHAMSVAQQVDDLIVHAFVNRIPDGHDTALLREAYARLQAGALTGDWHAPAT
jgi:hypothetical protein